MASLVTYGTVTEWGISESVLDSTLLADSFSYDVSTKNHVVTDKNGKNVGWIGYDQSASFSLSGRRLQGQQLGGTGKEVASLLALSSISGGVPAFTSELSPGLDAFTAVIEGVSYSSAAESAVSLTFSGTIYNFAPGS